MQVLIYLLLVSEEIKQDVVSLAIKEKKDMSELDQVLQSFPSSVCVSVCVCGGEYPNVEGDVEIECVEEKGVMI